MRNVNKKSYLLIPDSILWLFIILLVVQVVLIL